MKWAVPLLSPTPLLYQLQQRQPLRLRWLLLRPHRQLRNPRHPLLPLPRLPKQPLLLPQLLVTEPR